MNYVDVLYKLRRTYEAAGLREEAKDMVLVIAGVERLEAERDALRKRIEDAPIVEVRTVGMDERGNHRVYAISTPDELMKGPPLLYKRVRLVVEDAQ